MDKRSYIIRKIPKKNGDFRTIAEPKRRLKALQRTVLKWLMARRIGASKYAMAFVKGRSIADNAKLHAGKKVVVVVDVKDFFGSITKEQVFHALKKEGINETEVSRIVEICTLDGCLPQGAPTSPLLSNIVFKHVDHRLAGLAKKWEIRNPGTEYSRYADDMIFSSNDAVFHRRLLPIVEKFLTEEGFVINRDKTKVLRNGNRQTVTGIVVNQKPNVPRKERRRLRAELYNIKKSLIEGKENKFNLSRLQGKAAFIKGINPESGRKFVQEVNEIKNLLALRKSLSN